MLIISMEEGKHINVGEYLNGELHFYLIGLLPGIIEIYLAGILSCG